MEKLAKQTTNHKTIAPLFQWGRLVMKWHKMSLYIKWDMMREKECVRERKMGPHSYMKRIWTLFWPETSLSPKIIIPSVSYYFSHLKSID